MIAKIRKHRTSQLIRKGNIVGLIIFLALFNFMNIEASGQVRTSKLRINLLRGGLDSSVADGCLASFDSTFSKSIGGEDIQKVNNANENISINRNGTLLAIEGRPNITDNDTVPLKITQYTQSDYYLSFQGTNFPTKLTAFIKDKLTGIDYTINLYGKTFINHTITSNPASAAADRYYIVFKPSNQCASPTWTGSVSSDWFNPNNWCPAMAPGPNANVIIPANATVPPALSSATTVNNLILNGPLLLSGQTLTINGAVTGGGSLSGTATSNLIIGGNAGVINFTPGFAILYSLHINPAGSATVAGNLQLVGK
jgi:hypothetical protein